MSEPAVKEGVHYGITGGIIISNPKEQVKQQRWYRVTDEGINNITKKKRNPEGQKHPHDGLSRSCFSLILNSCSEWHESAVELRVRY